MSIGRTSWDLQGCGILAVLHYRAARVRLLEGWMRLSQVLVTGRSTELSLEEHECPGRGPGVTSSGETNEFFGCDLARGRKRIAAQHVERWVTECEADMVGAPTNEHWEG